MARFSKQHVLNTIWLLTIVQFGGELIATAQEVLPHPCDAVKCPPLDELSCPADSEVRKPLEQLEPLEQLGQLDRTQSPTAAALSNNSLTDHVDEEFAECCLAKKCVCRTCYIPDCHKEGEVVVELQPENMDMPGHCCGQYECQREPNCSEVRETDSYWLTDCQRCKCYGGQRICHQSCDEGLKKPAICHSKNLNKFFEHGDSWKDGCYECECVNGEPNCVITFCRSVNCPTHRQVMLKDSCCPVCWPKGIPMPNADEDYDGELGEDNAESGNHYEDEELPVEPLPHAVQDEYAETDNELLPHIPFEKNEDSRNTSSPPQTTEAPPPPPPPSEPSTTTTSTANHPHAHPNTNQHVAASPSPTVAPCRPNERQEAPATYQVYPEVVEVVRHSQQNDLLYTVIGCLALGLVMLTAWNIHLRAKQRSYRPVSNFDDNFNKMTSNIKKMNDYV